MARELSHEDLQALLKAISTNDSEIDQFIHLLLQTGMRSAELYKIQLKDVSPEGVLHIRACKGSLNRHIPLNGLQSFLSAVLLSYQSLGQYLNTSSPESFTAKLRAMWGRRRFSILGERGRLYGLHSLRATAAMNIYRKTGDIMKVKAFLGHKSLDSTAAYLSEINSVGLGELVIFPKGSFENVRTFVRTSA